MQIQEEDRARPRNFALFKRQQTFSFNCEGGLILATQFSHFASRNLRRHRYFSKGALPDATGGPQLFR